MSKRRYRLGVICREGREFKMNRVFRDLPPQWEMEILISQRIAQADVDRLAGFDIVFYKSRAGRLLRLLEQVEARGKKVINPVAAVRRSKRRPECLERAAAQGVPVPLQYTGPLKEIPFDRYVVKSERESESYPTRMVRSEAEGDELRKQIAPDETVYAQAFLDSEWEYKLYCIGDDVFGFRQRPTLLDPDALATRHRIELNPALRTHALAAMRATGLEVGGVDFLMDGDTPRLTDLNSTPGLHKFPESSAALLRYFERCLGV